MTQLVKNLPAMPETWVRSLDWEDPLEKGEVTHDCGGFFAMYVGQMINTDIIPVLNREKRERT